MKRIYIFAAAMSVALLFIAASGGVTSVQGVDRTGSPVSTAGCQACHSGGSFNPTLTLTLKDVSNNVVTQYTPGTTYKLEVSFGGNTASRYGYQAVALLSNNANAGSLITANSFSKTSALNSRTYAEHNGNTNSTLYTLNWTAPASGSGQVSFYSRGIAANNTGGTSGDSPVSANALTITELITNHPSSNGTAIISSFTNCSTSSTGSLQIGSATSGVSQTISVNVGTAGTYNLSAVSNGVTFSGSGTFSATGAQNVVLTATGTPTTLGSNTFTLNTTPNCSFTRTVNNIPNDPSSNGTAQISSFINCTVSTTGNLIIGSAASGVSQLIRVNVGFAGTYNLSAVGNGLTFSGAGTFSATGIQNLVLTATGTPTTLGSNSFTLNTTPNCSFTRNVSNIPNDPSSNGTAVIASFVDCAAATSGSLIIGQAASGVSQTLSINVTNIGSYSISAINNGVTFTASGSFANTGVQTLVLTASGTPTTLGSNSFTLNTTPNCSFTRTVNNVPIDPSSNGTAVIASYNDCATNTAGSLILGQAASGVSQTLTLNVATIGSYNIGAVLNGVSFSASGNFANTGSQTLVLTASGTPTSLGLNTFTLNTSPNCSFQRNVAPAPNDLSSNGSAVISSFTNCDVASSGVLTLAEAAAGVSQTIQVDVASLGSYSISAAANGINFEASGSFTNLGLQDLVLNASGVPSVVGVNSFTTNTTPNCSFNKDVEDQGNSILALDRKLLHFYPNPCSDVIYFEQNFSENYQVSIYNLNAKLVVNVELNGNQAIDLSSLDRGMYFIKVFANNNIEYVGKLVKN